MSKTIITAKAPESSIADREILHGLGEIADYLRYMTGGELPPVEHVVEPCYSDGTHKPYNPADTHREMVRKAQSSWEWDF